MPGNASPCPKTPQDTELPNFRATPRSLGVDLHVFWLIFTVFTEFRCFSVVNDGQVVCRQKVQNFCNNVAFLFLEIH